MSKAEFEFVNNFHLVKGKLQKGYKRNVQKATTYYEGRVKDKVSSGGRSGKVYRVPGTSRMYTASAPGEAPAVQHGLYAGSITHQIENKVHEISGTVGTNQKQAKRLEFGFSGTDRLGRSYSMAPRPHFKSTYASEREKIKRILSERIDV